MIWNILGIISLFIVGCVLCGIIYIPIIVIVELAKEFFKAIINNENQKDNK